MLVVLLHIRGYYVLESIYLLLLSIDRSIRLLIEYIVPL